MRIVYGVFGYGRGHATRALSVLTELRRRHEVLLLAGGDAWELLSPRYPVVRIPTLRYLYAGGRRSVALTLRHNLGRCLDVVLGGRGMKEVLAALRAFRPNLAISDAEPWTHQAASTLGVPRISFDHYGILAYCRPELAAGDEVRRSRDVALYRLLMGTPEAVIVSSFYDAAPAHPRVRCVPALLRPEVLRARPTRGDHLLAYFNNGQHQLTRAIEEALRAERIPVRVYGSGRVGSDGNLHHRPPGDHFVDDLASCRAVLSTAGNQLVGEALHLGKPLLVVPEGTVEQRTNALAVERLGVGLQAPAGRLGRGLLRDLLDHEARFSDRARALSRDGRDPALAAIEGFARELTRRPRGLVARSWRYA